MSKPAGDDAVTAGITSSACWAEPKCPLVRVHGPCLSRAGPCPSGPTSLARKTPRESWLQSVRAHDRAGPTGARGRRLARPAGARPPPGWSVPAGPNPKAGRGTAVRPGPAADPSRCTTRITAPQLQGGCDAAAELIPASQPRHTVRGVRGPSRPHVCDSHDLASRLSVCGRYRSG